MATYALRRLSDVERQQLWRDRFRRRMGQGGGRLRDPRLAELVHEVRKRDRLIAQLRDAYTRNRPPIRSHAEYRLIRGIDAPHVKDSHALGKAIFAALYEDNAQPLADILAGKT